MIKRIIIFTLLIFAVAVDAREFSWIAERLAFLEFPGGKNGLGAITSKGEKLYVVTTQSLFLEYGTDFVLKDFEGNNLKVTGTEICTEQDLIRFEVDINHYIKHFKPGGSPKSMYLINAENGTVSEKAFSLKSLSETGVVVVDEKDDLSGFISFTDGDGKKSLKLIPVNDKNKWNDTSIRGFETQISNILEMKEKIISIEGLKKANRMNSYVEYLTEYHESHISWLEDKNEQYENSVFNAKRGKSSAAAKYLHMSRCRHYTALKRLYIFAGNIIQIDSMTKWKSKFLAQLSKDFASRAEKINKSCKSEIDKLLKDHPSTKIKN